MSTTDDTAALIERAKAYADEARRVMAEINADPPHYVDYLDRLAAALERATADAARMRDALQMMLHIEPRDLGHVDTIRAYQAARAALEPRHD